MFGVFIAIVHFAVTVNALVRSVAERFIVGIWGGAMRSVLLVLAAVLGFRVTFPGAGGPSAGAAVGAVVAAVVGPLVSFFVVFVAYRRTRNIPAKDEERAGRPLLPWVAVACIDAIYVVIALLAAAFVSAG
jgi:hypothetical protein